MVLPVSCGSFYGQCVIKRLPCWPGTTFSRPLSYMVRALEFGTIPLHCGSVHVPTESKCLWVFQRELNQCIIYLYKQWTILHNSMFNSRCTSVAPSSTYHLVLKRHKFIVRMSHEFWRFQEYNQRIMTKADDSVHAPRDTWGSHLIRWPCAVEAIADWLIGSSWHDNYGSQVEDGFF